MKIRCKYKAFYNEQILRPGDVLDIKGKKCPDWAVIVEEKKEDADNQKGQPQQSWVQQQQPQAKDENELDRKSEEELNEMVDKLLTQALDAGIEVDIENKTSREIIEFITSKLEGKE